ncbi:PREDICTED: zinc finger protein 385A-like [Cyphomyrmex costatus]|uniref:zinc finger protein 385A-like n=1 Tax=Cyphomyrmex costatus TaxID=456900 RepID=UPI000852397A|nr:PREDICTED: zinc finger protein 385A-like [Cyphomyrmex costatus]XP_018403505.1 PREDICTED: zinc finger protein 385A-like [Cyphomyrmex costatus]XP_018403506.1 PREDICTED: zinc finger protein 385A-like [Cyphomyrmex costatus]
MAVPSENVMNTNLDDPITKAVVDNIMGNLPTKKPLVRCEDCDLSFTSQAVLDTHLQGARHAKQVRSKNIMATLEETKISFTKDEETNGLKCNVCNVCLNSIQQLQTHLNGSRHKKKLMRGGWGGKTRCPALPAGKLPVSLRTTYLRCNICNKFFNSISQYNSHINSDKHAYKASRSHKDPNNKKIVPYWRPKRNKPPKE